MRTLTIILIGLVAMAGPFADAPVAQATVAALKKELRERETTAGQDTASLLELAVWAKEKGLINDRRRILQKIVKLDGDHEAAREMLGYVRIDGEWVTKSKAKLIARRKLEEEMKAKGLVEVDGVWVEKDEVADAKKGIFQHDGERVSRAEKLALAAGQVRHPRTGEFIPNDDLPKAESGQFPIGDGKWAGEAEADRYHADRNHPWVYRSEYCTLVCTKPLREVQEHAATVDSAVETAFPLFGGKHPSPVHRPVILIANDTDHYRSLGDQFGDEGSAYAVFRAINPVDIPQLGSVVPIVTNFDANWAPYWLRHAAGFAYASALAAELEAELPLWFVRGVAGLCERHFNDGIASWFGKRHLQTGGVGQLGEWFDKFEISPQLEYQMLDHNIFQAGLVIAFAMHGKDQEALAAVEAVTEAFDKDGKSVAEAVQQLGTVVRGKEDALRAYFRVMTQN